MTADEIKAVAIELGADLCGIASAERFSEAPAGFHPCDVSPECRSVLVFAKRQPAGSMLATNCIPYTYINRLVTEEVERRPPCGARRSRAEHTPSQQQARQHDPARGPAARSRRRTGPDRDIPVVHGGLQALHGGVPHIRPRRHNRRSAALQTCLQLQERQGIRVEEMLGVPPDLSEPRWHP